MHNLSRSQSPVCRTQTLPGGSINREVYQLGRKWEVLPICDVGQRSRLRPQAITGIGFLPPLRCKAFFLFFFFLPGTPFLHFLSPFSLPAGFWALPQRSDTLVWCAIMHHQRETMQAAVLYQGTGGHRYM